MRDQTNSATSWSSRKECEQHESLNLITKKDLSLHLNLSISMIDKLMVRGLPHKKIGRSVRFNLKHVAEFLDREEHPMQKKDLEKFRGKRILMAVPNAPGISRVLTWNEKNSRYETPTFGKSYCARRYAHTEGRKKREFEYFDTLEKARLWQQNSNEIDLKISVESSTSKNKTSPTVRAIVDRWKRDRWPSLAINTKIQYEKCLNALDTILEMEIEEIRPTNLDDLISKWKKDLIKSETRTSFEKELQTLKIIMRWYQKNYDDATLVDPFKDRHSEQIKVKPKKAAVKKHMTDNEVEQFLQALKKDSQMFYVLGFTQLKQMMRVSEVTAMKWYNLNVEDKVYDLCEHTTWPRVKGSEHVIEPGTKNIAAGQIYTLNLFSDVVTAILSLNRKSGCDLIFHDDGKVLSYRQVQYRYDKAFAAAGLPYRSTHILRHTGSTSFYNETGDLLALQQMGTWADARMPQHYAKVRSSRAKNAIKELEKKRNSKSEDHGENE